MRAKVTKFIWGDIADISISRFTCAEDRILNIIELFEYKTVIVQIGDVGKNSDLLQAIKKLSIHYKTSLYDDLLYTDVVLMLDACNLKELIHYIFVSECESFSMEEIGNQSNWEKYLYNRFNKHQLIMSKIIMLGIVAVMNESQINITFHRDTYDAKQVLSKIKEQL